MIRTGAVGRVSLCRPLQGQMSNSNKALMTDKQFVYVICLLVEWCSSVDRSTLSSNEKHEQNKGNARRTFLKQIDQRDRMARFSRTK